MPRVSEDHLAARRRQILDGARRCFAEYGYDRATVRRLEQTIGLSRGAIFHHFRDKDALFFELAREDAERMADVASREGLIQVMRDMLAAPDQFDWLATRLEIARKLRNDPEFHRGWSERSAELSAATTDAAAPAEAGRPTARRRARAMCCRPIWTWCSTAWWPGWRPATTRKAQCACSISSRTRSARRADAQADAGQLSGAGVRWFGPAAAAHRRARLAQHAVDRPVRRPVDATSVRILAPPSYALRRLVQQLIPRLVRLSSSTAPSFDDPDAYPA